MTADGSAETTASVSGNGVAAPPAPEGSDAPATAPTVDDRAPVVPDDLAWQTTYDRASVEAYLSQVDAERAKLEEQIAAAEARTAAARERADRLKAADESKVAALVLAARAELDRMESEHRAAVDGIRSAALEKAARILEVARAEAATVTGAGATIAGVLGADASPPPASSPADPVPADAAPVAAVSVDTETERAHGEPAGNPRTSHEASGPEDRTDAG
ncbi:MAG: hypothetical protein MUE36_11670 [Acidimicrobiales bacterium]|jgi:hypothetical protein|nr:hypothetical protein [Acidimicrobiales bacterium]